MKIRTFVPTVGFCLVNLCFEQLFEDDSKHFYVMLGILLNLARVMLPSSAEVRRFPYLKLLEVKGRLPNSYCKGCQHRG